MVLVTLSPMMTSYVRTGRHGIEMAFQNQHSRRPLTLKLRTF